MKNLRLPMTLAFLSAGLFLMTFVFVTLLGGARIGFLYARVPGFNPLHSLTQWAGVIAALAFLVSGIIVAVPIAVRPASWPRKVAAVLPILLLLFALAGVISLLLDIGTIGNVAALPVLGPVTFATGWLALATVLAVLALVIAVATANLGRRTWHAAAMGMGFTSLASVVAAVAMVGMLIVVANNQPSARPFGNPNGAQATRQATPGARPAEDAPGAGNRQGGEGTGGGQFPQGRPRGEGGPGPGGLAATRQQFMAAGALMVLFGLAEVFATLAALRRLRSTDVAPDQEQAGETHPGLREGAGGAILAGLGVILVALGLIQLVPVNRANPPVASTVQWDSPQTQELWQRACADCHSDQTQWPWYTAIAPGSWLTAAHVNGGRQRFNISQAGGEGGSERGPSAGESVQQIRSGAMPPADYTLIHPAARLTDAEKQLLIQGLQNSLP